MLRRVVLRILLDQDEEDSEDVQRVAGAAPAVQGSAALSLDDVDVAAAGTLTVTASAAVQLSDSGAASDSSPVVVASAAVTLDDAQSSAFGAGTVRGSSAVVLGDIVARQELGPLTVLGVGPLSPAHPYAELVFDIIGQGPIDPNLVTIFIDGVMAVSAGVPTSASYAVGLTVIAQGLRVTVSRPSRYWQPGNHSAQLSVVNDAGVGSGSWTWSAVPWRVQDPKNCTLRDPVFISVL